MANSPLVSVRKLSPNCTAPRNHAIDRLTPHHTAGVLSVESALDWFAKPSTLASCNYVIGNDGRIGLCVNESDRAWTSSSRANDNRAITFEVVNAATGGVWPVSYKAFDALVNLCVDICKRYGKKKLLWIADKDKALAYEPKADEMLLTMHKWFANTNCPGEYLGGRFPELAETVNKILNESEEDDMTEQEVRKIVQDVLNGVDSKPSEWAEKEVAEAKALGITDGSRPQGYLKREEAFALFNRYDEKHGAGAAVKEAVAAVIEKIKGVL